MSQQLVEKKKKKKRSKKQSKGKREKPLLNQFRLLDALNRQHPVSDFAPEEMRFAMSKKLPIAKVMFTTEDKIEQQRCESFGRLYRSGAILSMGRKDRRRFKLDIPVSAQRYTGPYIPPGSSDADECTVMLLEYEALLASDAGGVIASVFGNAPNVCSNWADCNAVWGEYRTLAFDIHYGPDNRYSKSTTVCVPLAVGVDRRNSTAWSSWTSADAHESCRMVSLEDFWEHGAKMDGSEEAQFIVVSSPSSNLWIKTYTTGLSISTTYGVTLVYYLVQFRNVE
jgi:hypothetical protein